MVSRIALLAALAASWSSFALADETAPGFSGSITVEVEADSTFDSDDPAAELTDVYTTIEAGLTFRINEVVSFNTVLLFEPVIDAEDDRFFEDHGLYADELFVELAFDDFAIRAGKIHPNFAIAWDAAPGLYGADFAEDYEIAEQIGADVTVPFTLGGAEHEFSASVFFVDTTFLSRSLFEDRGRTTQADGGAGDTESLESVALSLQGEVHGTGYALGLRRRAEPDAGGDDETGGSAALLRGFALGESTDLELLGEIAYFTNFDGGAEDALYGTAGAALSFEAFTLSASYTLRDVEGAADEDHLLAAGLDYEIMDGLSAGLGYKFEQVADEDTHTVGAVVVFEHGF